MAREDTPPGPVRASAARGPARPRVLRVGLLLGGKIVEERLIRPGQPVTVGQSVKNTFTVPLEGVPRTHTLFKPDGARYQLCFTTAMKGQVVDANRKLTLRAAIDQGVATPSGDGYALTIDSRTRGKISIGGMSLLFQSVAAPTLGPPPKLPASIRGTFTDRVDPMLAVILAISLTLHTSVAMYAYMRDRVVREPRTARVFNETFDRPVVRIEETPFERPKEPPPEPDKAEKVEKQADEPKPATSRPRRTRERTTTDDSGGTRSAEEALRLQAQAQAAVDALLGDDFSETGIGGSTSDRAPDGALTAAMERARAQGVSSEFAQGAGRGTRGSTSTATGTSQGPGVSGPGTTTERTTTKVAERVPKGRIKVGGSASLDDTTLRPADVLRRIQQVYMNGLKRCHRELLKRDPGAGGTVTLRFTVGETGRVVRVKAAGFNDGVDRCIEQRAGAWRFGVPKDEDGDNTTADFKISLVLQPD